MTFFLDAPDTFPKIKANAPAADLPTWGAGLGAAGTSAQLENDSNFVAARRKASVTSDLSLTAAQRLGPEQVTAKMRERGLPQGMIDTFPTMLERGFSNLSPELSGVILDAAREAAAADPDAWADIDLTDQGIETQTNERLQVEYEDAQQILDMMPGGRGLAEFVGGMAGITADVKNLPFLALGGGGGSIVRVMGREAAINMGAEAAFLPSQYKMAERLDIPDPNVASQLAMAAAAGAAIGGAVTAAQRGWMYFRGRNQTAAINRMDDIQTRILVDQVEDILTSDTTQPFEQINRLIDEAAQEPPYQVENPVNPDRPPLLPTEPPEIITTPLDPVEPAPARAKPAGRRPTSLKTFVVRNGGIWKGDDTGEIAAMEYRRPGFVKKDRRVTSTAGDNGGGLRLDEMRERAVEEGYLPEGATINDFLEALDSDVRGTSRVYSQADGAAVEEWRIFDGEDVRTDAESDFRAMDPETDSGLFINREDFEFGGHADADIESVVRAWMGETGYSEHLTDAEAREIVAAMQEHGGDPEYLVERVLQREVEYVKSPEPEHDIPFGEPDQPRGSDGGRPASVTGQPGSEPGQAGSRGAGDGTGSARDRTTESTSAGDQTLIDGVAPITQRDRLQAQQNAPMRGGNAAADDGLFDVGARSQIDMFSDPTSPEARAVQDVVAEDMRTEIEADGDFDLEIETPDGGKRVMKASALLDYLDEGDMFSARIDLCGKAPE